MWPILQLRLLVAVVGWVCGSSRFRKRVVFSWHLVGPEVVWEFPLRYRLSLTSFSACRWLLFCNYLDTQQIMPTRHTKTSREIPREEKISSVESSLRDCSENPEKNEQVRASIASSIKNTAPPRLNTTPGERATLRSLKENKSITILPADKGNITVVVNTSSYEEKAFDILSQPSFKWIDRHPTAKKKTKREWMTNWKSYWEINA